MYHIKWVWFFLSYILIIVSNSSYANKSVCLRCWTLLKEGGPLEDATLLSDIPPVDVSTLHGTSNAWACSVCRDNVMTSTETNKHITK